MEMTPFLLIEIVLFILALAFVVIVLNVLLKNRNYSMEKNLQENFSKLEENLRQELSRSRNEFQNYQKNLEDSLLKRINEIARLQFEQLEGFSKQLFEISKGNETRLNRVTDILEKKMSQLIEDNNKKLEKMRETVDEKLQKTLETRLQKSFDNVSKMMERIQKDLGEMNKLSTEVTGLSRVLTNVKTRGILGEYQLESILEQLLTSEQYAKDVQTIPNSQEKVEFAIRLPGHKDEDEVWIPIDSKFPIENYQKLLDAYDQNDPERIKSDRKNLENNIKNFAKQVKKYINPPKTTDFAILFVPIEGLYAEIVRNPTLIDHLINQEKILIAGPNNFAAFLSALQVGFRTLSIEKRSAEVWNLLSDLRKGFGQFGVLLDKTQKKIQEAGNVISDASRKSRTIERKLKKVGDTSFPEKTTMVPNLMPQVEAPQPTPPPLIEDELPFS